VCPITNTVRNSPFEVPLPSGMAVAGVILSHHAKSVDWRRRRAAFIGVAPAQHIDQVVALMAAVLEID
jgi:mRNA interferase MazF